MARELFHESSRQATVTDRYYIVREPFLRLELPSSQGFITYSDQEFNLMGRLLFFLSRLNIPPTASVDIGWLGLGPGVGPFMLSFGPWNLDVHEIDPQVIRFVRQEIRTVLPFNIIEGDYATTFGAGGRGPYNLIINDIHEGPEDLTQGQINFLTSNLKANGKLLFREDFISLQPNGPGQDPTPPDRSTQSQGGPGEIRQR